MDAAIRRYLFIFLILKHTHETEDSVSFKQRIYAVITGWCQAGLPPTGQVVTNSTSGAIESLGQIFL